MLRVDEHGGGGEHALVICKCPIITRQWLQPRFITALISLFDAVTFLVYDELDKVIIAVADDILRRSDKYASISHHPKTG